MTDGQEPVRGRSPAAGLPAAPAGRARVAAVLIARTLLAAVVTLWATALIPVALGMTLSTVSSGSMAPAFLTGDLAVSRSVPASELRRGQVLLVEDPERPGRLLLHRLVAERDGSLVLRGDANHAPDSSLVPLRHVRGVAVLRVPFAGLPVHWLRTGALLPAVLSGALLAGLGLLACADPRPAADPVQRPSRTRSTGRIPRRKPRARALAVAATLGAVVLGVGSAAPSWATFTGIATSSTNTIGASTLFTNCPSRPGTLPVPSLYYAYTAATGTSEQDLAGSNPGVLTASATRQAGYCDGSAASPSLSLSSPTAQTQVSAGSKISSPTAAYSVSLWYNPTSSGGILASFADSNGIGSETVSDRRIYYRSDGSLAFGGLYGASGTGSVVYCSTTPPTTGAWHNLVATATAAGVMRLYVDGVQACTVTAATGPAPGAAAAGGFWGFGADKSIAGWSEGPNTGLVGSLDETTVYNSALTATDASNIYAAGH